MVYAAGVDDSEHEKYHKKKSGEKLVRFTKTSAKGAKPAHVVRGTAYYVVKESNKVVKGVHAVATQELGGNATAIDGDDGTNFVLAVKNSQVVGYCMFERIRSASVMGIKAADYAIYDCRRSVHGTLLGMRYLWVAKQYRRMGIANELIDAARKFGAYGHVFQRNKIAFTAPTRAGAQFALSYAPLKVRIRAASKTKEGKEGTGSTKEEKERCTGEEKEEKSTKKDVAGYIFVYRPPNTERK